jgi:hypothetical protein
MPRFRCRCGHSIPLHSIPCPHEAQLIWDVDHDLWNDLRREQWSALLEAKARGLYETWVQEFYGPPVKVVDNLTGRALSPTDPTSFPLIDILDDISTSTNTVTRAVVRCPECHRLYVQREHDQNEYDCYKPEPA